jgi:C-terminal processing protease CtpA/Prc
MLRFHSPLRLAAALAFFLAAVPVLGISAQDNRADNSQGVAVVKGSFKITNQFYLETKTEPLVVLMDMTAFLKRDHDMKLPFPDQTVAGVQGEADEGYSYEMHLPVVPRGRLNDVSHGKSTGKGVEIFTVDFDYNDMGDPFLGPYEWSGWSTSNNSMLYDPGTNEATSGKLLVWAPDGNEIFPTNFGPDGKLLTDDDPVGPIAQGWTLVNVDKNGFGFVRDETVDVPLEEGMSANNDLSDKNYVEAFDALVQDLKIRYTFNEYKKIDWDSIVKDIRPLIVQAEADSSKQEFQVAMVRFAARFHDGHLSVELPGDYYRQQVIGGVGLALGQTDEGAVLVRYITRNSPADKAGIKLGALITEWNGKPIQDVLNTFELLFASASSPHGILLEKLRYLTRGPLGTRFQLTYKNPGEAEKSIELTTVREVESLLQGGGQSQDKPAEMPVTSQLLPSGLGYIKVSTFFADPVLLTHSWEFAIKTMNQLKVKGLIIDMRTNGGGWGNVSTYFAGSFYKESFTLDKSYQADKNGKFLFVGSDIVDPAPVQWTGGPVAVLIGPSCASACEIFAAAMAHDPKHYIVGNYPTAGVEAGVEAWTLPDDVYFQAPVSQLQDPEGKIFLEGIGVPPNVKVPVTAETLLSKEDEILKVAEDTLLTAAK